MSKKRRFSGMGTMLNMTYRDLKAACIMKGMPFEEVNAADYSGLSYYYTENIHEASDRDKLAEYHEYIRKLLTTELGYSPDDPVVAFQEFATPEEMEGPTPVLKRSIIKKGGGDTRKKRKKKERDTQFGILKGTKKERIFKLTKMAHAKGWSKEKCLKKVVARAEKEGVDASEKSIKIWFKKAYSQL